MKQHGMNRHEIAKTQLARSVGEIKNLIQRIAYFIDALDCSVHSPDTRTLPYGENELANVIRVKPIIIVKKNQVLTSCCIHASVGGLSSAQVDAT